MKKLDLHIHTYCTASDTEFDFDINRLKEYVQFEHVDAIAITNHNLFNYNQYVEITKYLKNAIVFPGIEVNVTNVNGGFGHMIIIDEPKNAIDFNTKCKKVECCVPTPKSSITVKEIRGIFGNLERYLLVPHYKKEPNISEETLSELKDYVICGEVESPKKFIRCFKDLSCLTPLYFSDSRFTKDSLIPTRQTYFDIDEITLSSIKLCLRDHTKVSLSKEEGNKVFSPTPELMMSTGLNVIIGERSSGKTTTLDKIYTQNSNAKYIRQFELIETDVNKSEREFNGSLSKKNSDVTNKYLLEFSNAVNEVKSIDLKADERNIEEYINTLLKYSTESARTDAFSKCLLFNESQFRKIDSSNLIDLIRATEKLLDSTQYKNEIEKFIDRQQLIKLHQHLISLYRADYVKNKTIGYCNELIKNIQTGLQFKTATTAIYDVDLIQIVKNRIKIMNFEKLVNTLKAEKEIAREQIGEFSISVTKKAYENIAEIKNRNGIKQKIGGIYETYRDSPYKFLMFMKNSGYIAEADLYKLFVKIDYKILNKYNLPVSGGERAEYNLLQKLKDANQYDLLLIDEPESSFDNPFLRDRVNNMIKETADVMPVVIATHNNTIGVSLRPDYLIITKRIINKDSDEPTFEIYYGNATNKLLHNYKGDTVENYTLTIEYLEGGEKAYNERSRTYEMLKD